MFDRILLMAEGRVAFLGPIAEAPQYFASHGMPCPVNYNPADFYIFSLATVPGKEAESRQKIKYMCDSYDSSEAAERVKNIVRSQQYVTSRILRKLKSHLIKPIGFSSFQPLCGVLSCRSSAIQRSL